MRTPLIDRLDQQDPQLALFDARVSDVDRPRVRHPVPKETKRAQIKRMRRWQEWCAASGYQAEPEFITTEKLREWTVHMTRVQRYAPGTVGQALWVLERAAAAAGVDVSTKPAFAVLSEWRAYLKEREQTTRRQSREGD